MINPVLRREIQTSFRNRKVFGAIMFYVAVLMAVAGCIFWSEIYNSYDFSFDPSNINLLYLLMALMQLFLIIIIVPAITGGSINGEKEKQTFDLLLVSKMKPVSIVTGKLLAGICLMSVMIIAAAPVFAVTIQFGGASAKDVILIMLYFLAEVVCIGSVSIFFSSVVKKPSLSAVIVYAIYAFMTVGTYVLFMLYNEYTQVTMNSVPPEYIYCIVTGLNPFASVMAAVSSQVGIDVSGVISSVYYPSITYDSIWMLHIGLDAVITVLAVLGASRMINPLRGRKIKHS